MEVETKILSKRWLQIGSLQPELFHSDAVCSTTRHLHTRKGLLVELSGPLACKVLLPMLEDAYLNINYL